MRKVFNYMEMKTIQFFVFIVFCLGMGTVYAQDSQEPKLLPAIDNMPAPSACGEASTYTVTVRTGTSAHQNINLDVTLPVDFEYESGSIITTNNIGTASFVSYDSSTRKLVIKLDIPGTTAASDMKISFKARVNCGAIATASLPADKKPKMGYVLNGGTFGAGVGQTINVMYAALVPTITPQSSNVAVGDIIDRTISVRNNGIGTINSFTVSTTIGTGLEIVSSELTGNTGWKVEEIGKGLYQFSEGILSSGASVSIKQTVKVNACSELTSSYKVSYGCTPKECTYPELSNAIANPTITIDRTKVPNVVVTLVKSDGTALAGANVGAYCFDNDITHYLKIENKGTAGAKDLVLDLLTSIDGNLTGSTYFVDNSYEISENIGFTGALTSIAPSKSTVWDSASGKVFATTGKNNRVYLPVNSIAQGQVIYLRFKTRNNSYITGINCGDKRSGFLYGGINRSYTYNNANICSGTRNFSVPNATLVGAQGLRLEGDNVGASMISSDPKDVYKGKFRFSQLSHSNTSVADGDYFEVVFRFAPSMAIKKETIKLMQVDGTFFLPEIISNVANEYRLRFTYGPKDKGGNFSGNFAANGSVLTFDATYICSDPAWYELYMQTNRVNSCNSGIKGIDTQCVRTNLSPVGCTEGCDQGLVRGLAKVQRHPDSFGYVANTKLYNRDNKGLPAYPLTKITEDTEGVNLSAFHTNDKVIISQKGIVKSGTITNWTEGRFEVTVPSGMYNTIPGSLSSLNAVVTPNSGQLIIDTGTQTYTITDLPLKVSGTQTVTLDFTMSTLHANGLPATITHLENGYKLQASIQIVPNNFNHTVYDTGAKQFITDFHLRHNNLPYSCGPLGLANGLFAVSRFSFYESNSKSPDTRLAVCDKISDGSANTAIASAPFYRLNISINENTTSNQVFPRENRQFIKPKQLVSTVPEGLDLKGFYIQLSGQLRSDYAYYKVTLDTPVSGTTHTLNLEEVLMKTLTASHARGTGYDPSDYNATMTTLNLDEGFWVRITPIVSKNCKSGAVENYEAYAILEGTGRDAHAPHNTYTDAVDIKTIAKTITYEIDNNKLNTTIATPVSISDTNVVRWVIKTENSSIFHTFSNVWFGSTDMNITSVQQANDATGNTLIDLPLNQVNGMYQIGDVKPLTTKFYVVTADIPDCGTGKRNILLGHSCKGYPNSLSTPYCPAQTYTVTFSKSEGELQSSFISQPPADYRPNLCEVLDYDIEINSSGAGVVKDIQIRIPLGETSGLTFVPGSAMYTAEYKTGTVSPTLHLDDSNVTVDDTSITVSLPNTNLATGERIRFALKLRTTDDCSFSSNQRIGFISTGKNYCGENIQTPSTLTSYRLIIAGDITNLPEVTIDKTEAVIAFSDSNVTGNTKGTYTLKITNKGNPPFNQDIINGGSDTRLSIKLPVGWEILNTNEIEKASNNNLVYHSSDVLTNTYVFTLVNSIPINGVLEINALPIVATKIHSCPITDEIKTQLYYIVHNPTSVCSGTTPTPANCDMKKNITEAIAPLELIIPKATIKTSVNTVFCSNQTITDLNILVNENTPLAWYDNATGGSQLTENTPLVAGTYYVALRDKLVLGCESTERTPVTITTEICNPIVANNDVFPVVDGNVQSTAGNVLDNSGNGQDTLNGAPATTANVVISEVTSATSINGSTNVPKIDLTTGNVNVPANTPAGTYTIVYRICESGNPANNCDTATVTVVVSTIEANDDNMSSSPVDAATGNSNLVNVLTNDTLNGIPDIPISDVTITVTTQATPIGGSANVPVLDPATGNVSVPAGTPAGTYTITYQVCTKSTICDTANVVVVVTAQPIDAKDDTFAPVVGVTGAKAGSVLSDNGSGTDTLGSVAATTANVDISVVTSASQINGNPNVPTLDTNTGEVNISANTPAGTYTIVYRICEKLNPTNCDTATATVVVNPTDLEAVPDDFSGTPIRGTGGGNTPSVLTNDKLNGTPLNPSDVTLTWGATTPNGFTPNTDGTITIAPNTPAGTYTLTYTICEKLNPTNCETTTVTVVIVPDVIDAKDDTFKPITGVTGGTAGNVLSDNGNGTDTLGNVSATITNVDISVVTPASPINGNPNIPTLNTNTGDVNVPANTPAGTYTIVYRICEKLNPTNCDTATATVVVNPTDLEAVPDDFSGTPIRGTDGGNTPSVLTNDKLNGTPLNPSDVTLTWGATPPNGFTPNTDGTITIAPNTPAGTYTLTYTICEKLNPTNCETTTVTVLVTASPIVANDDDYTMYPIYTTVGGTVSTSVLINDTFEGVTATLGTVTISNPTTPNTNIYIDTADGMVVVLPNTPVGTYTLTYTICEKANPTNCSNQANVTVVVLDVPKASDDSATTEINTPVVVNILENDQNIPTTGRVSVVSDPSRGSVQVNDGGTPNDPSDDTITYTPNPGFVGTDTFVYELCDAAGNCSNATVTIEVVAGGDIIPYNAISTNDDGSNDIFYIKGIEGYPNNTVRIYNRWGVKVFEAQGYNNTTKVFRGLSNGRVTIEAPEKLPQGTYYYIIEYVDKNNQTKRKGSWLYIKN
ncbi:hypothetical protein CAPN010_19020 [Capnocytophaga cynodegmi]|uniref:T9SS type B sorting domain-containing protein n=1 Tax=Capnocytophaga cynodegmi TaxID=28189 RepID=UPI001EE1F35B|nr:gliding motility-associated C-terminal domain-containing protein [Capnocytophaga cynodegmi]GJQ07744.1 hypothetical protein CAPN010_19020 [Capnocytophaga cynodegmi]